MPWRVAQLTTEVHWAAVSEPGWQNLSGCGHSSAGGNRMTRPPPHELHARCATWRTADAGRVGTPVSGLVMVEMSCGVTDLLRPLREIPRCLISTSGG